MHVNNMDESHVLETETTDAEQEDTTADTESQEEEENPTESETEDIEALKAKAAKSDELEKKNKQLYERLKKTEKTKPAQEGSLSAKDFLALKDSNISAEDFDEVQDFAKYKRISIAEALKMPTLKTILNEKAEERRTAKATETRSPRGIAKQTGEDLLRKAETTGEVKESDIDALVNARLDRKRNRNK